MGELKQHPLPMTIDEQIKNLKSLGLIIENEEYAKKILNDISYFRLIKAYSLGFKPKNGKYEEGVTFEQIVELYLFNANFRQVTFAEIEKIEVNVRCRIANYFAEVYGVLGYMEPQNFVDEEYHRAFMADIEEEVRRNSKAPFVRNFKTNYAGGNLPIYALVEVFSFGTLSKFYKNMKNADKRQLPRVLELDIHIWKVGWRAFLMFAMFVRIMGGCIMQNFQRRLFFTKNIHKPV